MDFKHFNLSASASLALFNGKTSEERTEIARLTSSAFPNDITSYRPYMRLEMESDSSSTSSGFVLTLTSPDNTSKKLHFRRFHIQFPIRHRVIHTVDYSLESLVLNGGNC